MKKNKLHIFILLVLIVFVGCDESEPLNVDFNSELGGPIKIEPGMSVGTYMGLETHFYVPETVQEIKNRPMIFTCPPTEGSYSSMVASVKPIADKFGMIVVSIAANPWGDYLEFSTLLDSLIETKYVDNSNVFLAGFSAGGFRAYNLSLGRGDRIKGTLLMAPGFSEGFVMESFPVLPQDVAEKTSPICTCMGTKDELVYEINLELHANLLLSGVPAKKIEMKGYSHVDMISLDYFDRKFECFEFFNEK